MRQESRTLSFSGLRVHFQIAWPDAPARDRMLLLASPLTSAFNWRKLLPELSEQGCLAVLMDLPGFGRSDCAAPQEADARGNLIWGVLDDVDRLTGAPMSLWHLAAHGTACATILRMGAQYPDSVKSQLHIAPTFSLALRPTQRARWFDDYVADARRFHRLIEAYAGFPMDDYVVDRMRAPLLRPGMRRTVEQMLRACASPPRQGVGFCPTMALVGGRDPLMDAARLKQIGALLADAEVHRVASAGHFPMETHSKALRDYLRGWLRYSG